MVFLVVQERYVLEFPISTIRSKINGFTTTVGFSKLGNYGFLNFSMVYSKLQSRIESSKINYFSLEINILPIGHALVVTFFGR